MSKLKWTTEQVSNSFGLSSTSISSHKLWLGILHGNQNTFKLAEPRKVFALNPFRVIIKGTIRDNTKGSELTINFKPDFRTAMFLSILFLGAIVSFFGLIQEFGIESIMGVISFIAILSLAFALYSYKLKKSQKMIEQALHLE